MPAHVQRVEREARGLGALVVAGDAGTCSMVARCVAAGLCVDARAAMTPARTPPTATPRTARRARVMRCPRLLSGHHSPSGPGGPRREGGSRPVAGRCYASASWRDRRSAAWKHDDDDHQCTGLAGTADHVRHVAHLEVRRLLAGVRRWRRAARRRWRCSSSGMAIASWTRPTCCCRSSTSARPTTPSSAAACGGACRSTSSPCRSRSSSLTYVLMLRRLPDRPDLRRAVPGRLAPRAARTSGSRATTRRGWAGRCRRGTAVSSRAGDLRADDRRRALLHRHVAAPRGRGIRGPRARPGAALRARGAGGRVRRGLSGLRTCAIASGSIPANDGSSWRRRCRSEARTCSGRGACRSSSSWPCTTRCSTSTSRTPWPGARPATAGADRLESSAARVVRAVAAARPRQLGPVSAVRVGVAATVPGGRTAVSLLARRPHLDVARAPAAARVAGDHDEPVLRTNRAEARFCE